MENLHAVLAQILQHVTGAKHLKPGLMALGEIWSKQVFRVITNVVPLLLEPPITRGRVVKVTHIRGL
jgi:hypothetical protein